MVLAGRSRLILGLVFLWSVASLLNISDARHHRHPSYTETDKGYDVKRGVIQPIVRKSAQLASYNGDDAHPRYRRNALPVTYKSIIEHPSNSSVATPHCAAWSQKHFRTFDGKTYNFHGACQYTLVLDCAVYTFRISIQNDLDCFSSDNGFTPGKGASCNRTVVVHNGNAPYPIYLRPGLVVGHESSSLDLPTSLDGLVIERVGDSILVTSGLGYQLIYDGDESVTVYITSDSLRQQTCGLCGVYNDDPSDDFKGPFHETFDNAYDFGLSWKEDDSCTDLPRPSVLCTEVFIPPHLVHLYKDFIDLVNFAKETCDALQDDSEFNRCHSVVDVNPYIKACQRDMCNCQIGQDECACNSMSAYAMECARSGVKLDWRTNTLCPYVCPVHFVYQRCATTCTQMCGSAASDCEEDQSIGCIEGCRCPADRFLNNDGECVKEEECPCVSNGKEYESGSTIPDGCNECTCNGGKWTCTNNICETVCWASGDPHYNTFDNTRYNFMGNCAYHLVKDCWDDNDKFEIIADNAPCGHSGVTCTQKVVVKNANDVIILAGGDRASFNGDPIKVFPLVTDGIMVDRPTTLLTVVSLGNGMVVRWDGKNRVEIVAPPSKFNKTCGLCGTFNKNQADDFMTPDGDWLASPTAFGNSWKVTFAGDTCPDEPPGEPPDVCELYSQRKNVAFEQCNKLLTEDVFKPCHRVLDPGPYFQDCRYDVCNSNDDDSHCPMFSQYASDCREKDVLLKDWRKAIPECDVECDVPGMSYSECAPSCGASCQSIRAIANGAYCLDVCVEGCHCDHRKVVDRHGNCIPPHQCQCFEESQWYDNGETIKRNCETCVCQAGIWDCDQALCPIITCPDNQFYSECTGPPECQATCTNLHDPPVCDGPCLQGCECKTGYVLDNKECIPVSECKCYYRNEVYEPNEVRRVGCHVCTCKNGKVKCQNEYCKGTCIAWGDPHYQTFDAKRYDFQGECDYVLVTNSHYPEAKQFHILVGNVPCGSRGVTCTKAITMAIGTGAEQEKVMLVRGKPIEVDTGIGDLSEFTITEAGLYILVHTNIGVTLMWDRATRIEVRVTPDHFNRVRGLCGNYNDIQEDDFLPPGGGIPFIDPNDFGNSWKVHDYCGKPPPITHPCEENPHRKTWAQKKCSIINSPLFEPCHEYVPPADYFNNCVFDTCGCDSGGDCECMCTAIATYAQMCNQQGVPIKWRSQELCPVQCEGCLTYDPCIPVCESSCDNLPFVLDDMCVDTCVDGCICPPGTYLHNEECVEECPTSTTVLPPTTIPSTTDSETPPPHPPPPETCDCWGYGDPHYFDFNNKEFDDQGFCTYVLAKDKREPSRFTILIHNVECSLFPGTTCPRELEILYDGHRIRMLAERTDEGQYQIVIDGTTHYPPVDSYDSFQVIESGLYMLFTAPSIALQVRFLPIDLHFFKVEISKSMYFNSTEGLCGNCGNPLPTCQETGTCCDWLAPPSKPSECGCDVTPTECIPGPDIIDWCDKLYEDIFSECHQVLDPHDFYKNCLYDNCYADQPTCWDFEAYVAECSAMGICIDWREDDFCPYNCESDETHYRECACPDDIYTSCYPWDKEPHQCDMEPVSGCYCNEGSMDNGNETCVPCPTFLPTTPARTTVVYTTELTTPEITTVESTKPYQPTTAESTRAPSTTIEPTPPKATTVESTPPESTTVEFTPPPSTTVETTPPESTPPESTTVELTPPDTTTVESTPPESTPLESTTVESTPPESTTVDSTPPDSTSPESTPPEYTTVESTPPESTTVESTPPESTTVESTPPESTTVESTPPESTPPESTPPESTTPESTTVESTPPESTTVESTPPESTPPESTPPESTPPESTPPESTPPESTPPESTTVESTPPESTTVESTPPESTPPEFTTVESTPPESTSPESTTVESTPPESTPPESTPPESTPPESTPPESTPPESTTVESTPPESTTVESTPPESTSPESTTVESTPPESTPPESTPPESTPPESTPPESTPPESTTVESTPPESTTVESTPPESTTVESTPPESTTVESTPPESTTVESTPPESTTVESTPPESTTVGSTPPESTTVESTPPESTTVESTPPESTTVESTPPESTTVESTLPESTTVESASPESTTVESTPPESTTVESTPEPTTVESTTEQSTTPDVVEPTTTECTPGHQTVCKWSSYLDDENGQTNTDPYEFEFISDFLNNDQYEGVCVEPEAIECVLARDHDVPFNMTTQDVKCTKELGLACYDGEDQTCLDYAIRVQCCEEVYVICGSTESPPTTTVQPQESTTIVDDFTTIVDDFTTIVDDFTTVESTPLPSTTVKFTTVEPPTTACVPHHKQICNWTRYYDDNDVYQGDFEILEDLLNAYPEELCEIPTDIECVLSSDYNISAHQAGQIYFCDPQFGLVCMNYDNNHRPPYQCYDYAVRFKCCESVFVPCGTEEAPTTEPEVLTTKPAPTTESAPTEESTTECVEVVEKSCEWTPWLDDGNNKVGPLGEFELISTYREEYDICDTAANIECVLTSRPSVPSNETGQVVTCDVDEGLVCLHSEQMQFPPICFDYKIRVECCQEIVIPCNPHATKPVPTTLGYTTEAKVTTKPVPTPEQSTTAEEELTTKLVPTAQPSTTAAGESTTTIPIESTTTIPIESTTVPESTIPIKSTTVPESTIPVESTTPACKSIYKEVCDWTSWMDDDEGHPGSVGEFELISTFRDQYDFCRDPRQIQCALKSDHEVLVEMTKQKVVCNTVEGLICLHNNQPDIPRCFDYSIRLQCCSFVDIGCGTTPDPEVTTVASTTEALSTTAPPHNINTCRPLMPDRPTTIVKDGCSTPTPVYLPMCHGRCESSTVFSGYRPNGNELWKTTCRCCKPSDFETDYYELLCPNGESTTISVKIVTGCTCKEFECQ